MSHGTLPLTKDWINGSPNPFWRDYYSTNSTVNFLFIDFPSFARYTLLIYTVLRLHKRQASRLAPSLSLFLSSYSLLPSLDVPDLTLRVPLNYRNSSKQRSHTCYLLLSDFKIGVITLHDSSVHTKPSS